MEAPIELTEAQHRTIQTGSLIMLMALAVGTAVGQWPLWSAAAAGAGFLAWTVAYAEVTVRTMRR